MPGRTGAIIGNGEETVFAVWTYLGVTNGASLVEGIHVITESSGFLIEWDAYQSILQLFDVMVLDAFVVRYTIVDVVAIRGECRESGKGMVVASER